MPCQAEAPRPCAPRAWVTSFPQTAAHPPLLPSSGACGRDFVLPAHQGAGRGVGKGRERKTQGKPQGATGYHYAILTTTSGAENVQGMSTVTNVAGGSPIEIAAVARQVADPARAPYEMDNLHTNG